MLRYGFFNSLNHDRLYDADQISAIFNNIITDGVFDNYGKLFATRAGSGMQVIVGTGRAWFNSTWTMSDSDIILDIDTADVSMPRIDTVILEVNHTLTVRANSIKILKGTAATSPVAATLSTTGDIRQHALCYINIPAGAASITDSMLDIRIGKAECPFVTSVLESVSIDGLFAKWENDFTTWFDDLKTNLSSDVAANLQRQIDELKEVMKVKKMVHVDVMPQSGWWRNPSNKEIEVSVLCFGGGGGGLSNGALSGSGGGYMSSGVYKIKPFQMVYCTIGEGGKKYDSEGSKTGGTTSFGEYLSAIGAGPSSDGGTGGGGGGFYGNNSYTGYLPGNGEYGGGGGGGGGRYSTTTFGVYGGRGGSYGGEGGYAGCMNGFTLYPPRKPATLNPDQCGSGGQGGTWGQTVSQATAGADGEDGTDTTGLDLLFTGTGKGGKGGQLQYTDYAGQCGGGGGGGGGGYGGNGGNGGNGLGYTDKTHPNGGRYNIRIVAGAGGGGGGYGARGGHATKILTYDEWVAESAGYGDYKNSNECAGGGGGGYGGEGGDAWFYYGGGGGGYGPNNYGAGHGAFWQLKRHEVPARSGVVVIRYVTDELIPPDAPIEEGGTTV